MTFEEGAKLLDRIEGLWCRGPSDTCFRDELQGILKEIVYELRTASLENNSEE